jgi:hypothetical protein
MTDKTSEEASMLAFARTIADFYSGLKKMGVPAKDALAMTIAFLQASVMRAGETKP